MEKIIIEVGANDGGDTFRYAQIPDSFVYAFEPATPLYDKLKTEIANRGITNIEIVKEAVSDEDTNELKRFGISDPNYGAMNMGCSSLNEFNPNIHSEWPGRGDFNFINYEDVKVTRLDKFIKERGIEEIEYLHIDAQGSDFNVLKSLGKELNKVKAGRCEASNTVNLYKEVDNNVNSILNWLNEQQVRILRVCDHWGNEINISDLKNSSPEVDIHFERIAKFNI